MTEQITDKSRIGRHPAILPGDCSAKAQVTQHRLARDQPLVRQYEPWADLEFSAADEFLHLSPALGTHFQVVVEHYRLAISGEWTAQFAGCDVIQSAVQQLDQALAIVLKCLIPFAVPVGAKDIMHFAPRSGTAAFACFFGGHGCEWTCYAANDRAWCTRRHSSPLTVKTRNFRTQTVPAVRSFVPREALCLRRSMLWALLIVTLFRGEMGLPTASKSSQ